MRLHLSWHVFVRPSRDALDKIKRGAHGCTRHPTAAAAVCMTHGWFMCSLMKAM